MNVYSNYWKSFNNRTKEGWLNTCSKHNLKKKKKKNLSGIFNLMQLENTLKGSVATLHLHQCSLSPALLHDKVSAHGGVEGLHYTDKATRSWVVPTSAAQAVRLSDATGTGTLMANEALEGKSDYTQCGNEPNSTVLTYIQEPKPCVPACPVWNVSSEQRFQIS